MGKTRQTGNLVSGNILFSDITNNRIGIGTTTVNDKVVITHADDEGLTFKATGADGTTATQITYEDTNGGTGGVLQFDHDNNSFSFETAGSPRATIDSSGRLLVGTSTAPGSTIATTALLQVQGRAGYPSDYAVANIRAGYTPSGADAALGFLTFSDSSNNIGAWITGYSDAAWTSGSSHPSRLMFATTADGASSPTERMRINAAGYTKFSNDGSPTNTNLSFSSFDQSTNDHILYLNAKNASYTAAGLAVYIERSATSAYSIASFYSTHIPGISADNEFNLRGDGNGYCDGAWTGGGADYAEYFEWSDGNPDEDDRRGIAVVLDGDKIRPAVVGEDPIGVISGNPSVVGDAAWNKWSGKYLCDDYGTYIQEDYEVEDEDGNTVIQQRRKLNPAYDPDQEYVSREQRSEWDCVGLMGKLRIRKGQPTGSRWIKMRDISDSVEEWLVR